MNEIEYVESADPLVKLIKSNPYAIFQKLYLGYLLFLFGEADREASAWIKDHLIALDSLTGPDIAGVIFAKSFNIDARVYLEYTSNSALSKITDNKIDIKDVEYNGNTRYSVAPIFSMDIMDGSGRDGVLRNLTATTYASDEIARFFGVVADLPCIVFVDPVPTQIKILKLNDNVLPIVIKIIRETIGEFIANDDYEQKRTLLQEIYSLEGQLEHAKASLSAHRADLQRVLQSTKTPSPMKLRGARQALMEGSRRQFIAYLSEEFPLAVAEAADERARHKEAELYSISRTIRGISWYLDFCAWPLSCHDDQRLANILEKHVISLVRTDRTFDLIRCREDVLSILTDLRSVQNEIISGIWGNLPDPDKLQAEQTVACESVTNAHQRQLVSLSREVECISANLAQVILKAQCEPTFTGSFASVIERYNLQGVQTDATKAIFEKLLSSISTDVVRLVARDIYISNNVGAVGPRASASDVLIAATERPQTYNSDT